MGAREGGTSKAGQMIIGAIVLALIIAILIFIPRIKGNLHKDAPAADSVMTVPSRISIFKTRRVPTSRETADTILATTVGSDTISVPRWLMIYWMPLDTSQAYTLVTPGEGVITTTACRNETCDPLGTQPPWVSFMSAKDLKIIYWFGQDP